MLMKHHPGVYGLKSKDRWSCCGNPLREVDGCREAFGTLKALGMCVCKYTYMYVSMYVCMYASVYVCMYVCMYMCMSMCIYMYVCICIYVCTCMYACMCVVPTYIYMYIHVHN